MVTLGYGRSGNLRMGNGDPPRGWPEDIPWAGFVGTTRSHLNIRQITHVIVSLLEAAGIDPEQHVHPDETEEVVEEDAGAMLEGEANEVYEGVAIDLDEGAERECIEVVEDEKEMDEYKPLAEEVIMAEFVVGEIIVFEGDHDY